MYHIVESPVSVICRHLYNCSQKEQFLHKCHYCAPIPHCRRLEWRFPRLAVPRVVYLGGESGCPAPHALVLAQKFVAFPRKLGWRWCKSPRAVWWHTAYHIQHVLSTLLSCSFRASCSSSRHYIRRPAAFGPPIRRVLPRVLLSPLLPPLQNPERRRYFPACLCL